MNNIPVLSVAVPTYNMERWLEKNLETYRDPRLAGRLEVICVNNDSTDRSKDIIESFCSKAPDIFTMIDRDADDYGAAINDTIAAAKGVYFRIVDADDWVNTDELVKLVDTLEKCSADVILTDYRTVNLQNGEQVLVAAGDLGAEYNKIYTSLEIPMKTLPSIHCTTYRTKLLRDCNFAMQTGVFYADEEFVILPWLHVKTLVYYPYDVYRYLIANPNQSMAPGNRAKYHSHREKILCRLIREYHTAVDCGVGCGPLAYCRYRIALGAGDYFTTLYIYLEDRAEGRRLAKQWKTYLQNEAQEFWQLEKKKANVLRILNLLHVTLPHYISLKRIIRGNRN